MEITRAKYFPRQSINANTFDGTYQALGSPITEKAVLIKVVNNSDQLIDISTDGTTDEDVAPANSYYLYDMDNFSFPRNQQLYVKGNDGTGLVYLVIITEV